MPGVGFGKSDKLHVQLTSDLTLPESLEEIKQDLSASGAKLLTGIVTINNDSYPVILVTYLEEYKRKPHLCCHTIFDQDYAPKVTKELTNRISKKATKKILAMEKGKKFEF